MRPFTARRKNAFQGRTIFFLLIASLVGFSSCQRAPYAHFQPAPEPAFERVTQAPPTPAAEPSLTASLDETVALSTKPVWEKKPVSTVVTEVRRPALRRPLNRLRFGQLVPPSCDQIVLRNGDVIEAKIKEVGVNEIKYKKCDRQDGPDYTISKRDVLSIKYTNGDVERFNAAASSSGSSSSRSSYDSPTNAQQDGPRTDPFSIVALATGGLAILTGYGAFLLGAVAIVFGAMSLSRIRKEPARFKGKGLAIAGMVAGIVAAGVILLYILL
jgi:hypothetical protein